MFAVLKFIGEDKMSGESEFTELSHLLTEPNLPLETCIDVVFKHLCTYTEESSDKSLPAAILTQTITLIKNQLKATNTEKSSEVQQETLLKVTKIMAIYTKVGSEGAIHAAKLLTKLLKVITTSCEALVRFICAEMTSVIEKKQGQQRVNYYCLVLKMLLGKCSISEEIFTEAVFPVMTILDDGEETGRKLVVMLGTVKSVLYEWLLQRDMMWVGLERDGFFKEILHAIERDKFHIDQDKLHMICQRVSDLGADEFDSFISNVFEYLIEWEDNHNFETLGVIVDLLDVILGIVPEDVKEEIQTGLQSIEFWHVKLLVCLELFGEPGGDVIEENEKSDDTLPLEIYLALKANSSPPESLIQRVYSIRDDTVYKFCTIVLLELFKIDNFTTFELEVEEINEKVKALKSKYGSNCVSRIRNFVLNQE
ncbi:uncharacterized protein LOC110859889 [Folsomia candida]|uniref:uncharacterized protein LOC110859889 n=1 Tax=Folsomia candida TaxID=158441 RepID=UPI001604DB13|nr:uncharacterized protein LOC110859889 [Folsomia candida]